LNTLNVPCVDDVFSSVGLIAPLSLFAFFAFRMTWPAVCQLDGLSTLSMWSGFSRYAHITGLPIPIRWMYSPWALSRYLCRLAEREYGRCARPPFGGVLDGCYRRCASGSGYGPGRSLHLASECFLRPPYSPTSIGMRPTDVTSLVLQNRF